MSGENKADNAPLKLKGKAARKFKQAQLLRPRINQSLHFISHSKLSPLAAARQTYYLGVQKQFAPTPLSIL